MENVKVEYSDFYLHAMKEITKAHDALVAGKFQDAYDHCINAQVESVRSNNVTFNEDFIIYAKMKAQQS